ncbi:MAG TPA: polyphenol oxidase family protein [Acidimicrobiales bacterium]|nr:polyphenol oxidase family protein [Acidimicrobiales bacterium]
MTQDLLLVAQQRGELTVYPAQNLRALGVDAFVTDRFGGVSEGPYDSLNLAEHVGDDEDHVRENRVRVATAAGVEFDRLVTVRQVHGDRVLDATLVAPGDEADALVSDDPALAIAMLVADCVPLVLADESTNKVAVVHAGWRGLAAGVIARSLDVLSPPGTHAFIGPAISQESYQVGPEVAEHFTHIPGALAADGEDRSRLDLRLVAVHQLLAAGVRDDRIALSRQVTDGGSVFFSDRAQRPCGRFSVVARRAVA